MSCLITHHTGREFVAVPSDGAFTDNMKAEMVSAFSVAMFHLPDEAQTGEEALAFALLNAYRAAIQAARADSIAAHAIGVAKHGIAEAP